MKRMNAAALRNESGFDATMNAVIIYDKPNFAAEANALLERAAHQTDQTTHWSVKLWRVDMLKLPPAADAALAEAAEAHVILLAVTQVQSLPPWLVAWLERWAVRRLVPDAALAVWEGGNADTRPVRATHQLSQFAGHHSLSLIPGDHALAEGKSSRLGSDLYEREDSLTPTLQHILEQPLHDYYQHWGINE